MIATFAIEICLAVYTLFRYGLTPITRIATGILACLAVFQLAEFNICEGSLGLTSEAWSRLGFVAITLLPPMGIHLATKLAGDKQRSLVIGGYALSAAFAGYFLLASNSLSGSVCNGNYVIFEMAKGSGLLYGLYYYALLIIAVVYAWNNAGRLQNNHSNRARALKALAVGYMAFMIPTTAVNLANPGTISAIPSIMCGFAIVLALFLAGEVLPQYYKKPTIADTLRERAAYKV